MSRFKKSNQLVRSLRKTHSSIQKRANALRNVKSKLKAEEKCYSRAKSSFRGKLQKFDRQVIRDNDYLTIGRNLHHFRKEEVAALFEIEQLKEQEVKLSQNGREDLAEARNLERQLMDYTTICVASLENVEFLSDSSFGHAKVGVVAGCSEAVKQEIREFCRHKGLKI